MTEMKTFIVLVTTICLWAAAVEGNSKKAVRKQTAVNGSGPSNSGIREVKGEEIAGLTETNEDLLVLFYDAAAKGKNKLVFKILDKLDTKPYTGLAFVKTPDAQEALELGVEGQLPKLVLFQNGLPELYEGDELTELGAIKTWLKEELEDDNLDVLDIAAVEKFAKSGKPILAIFVDDSRQKLTNEEAIVSVCDKLDVNAVIVDDDAAVAKYGLDELPAYVYFEDGVPTLYEDEDEDGSEATGGDEDLLEWIEEQRTSDTIEEVTEEILQLLAKEGLKEYVAVFFTGPCDENAPTAD